MSRSETIAGCGCSSSMTIAAPTPFSVIPARTCIGGLPPPVRPVRRAATFVVRVASTLDHGRRSGRDGSVGAVRRGPVPQIGFAPVATRTSIRRGPALALALLAATGAAGCNKNSADVNAGKALFSARCSTCHQLADEGPGGGTQGPNLDDAFHTARLAGMDSDTVAGIVKAQVENPRPSGQNPSDSMPADLASGQELDDIAEYVGAVAGTGIKAPPIPGGKGGQVFVTAQPTSCSSCHTLQAAHASATTGPNLDDVIPGMSAGEIKQSIIDPN